MPPSSPRPRTGCLSKRRWQSWTRQRTPGAPVIPQLLAKDGALAAWMIGELRKMGYTEVNLNFGCPSGTVTAKGKGAGMLRDLSKLEVFLDEVFSQPKAPSRSRPGWRHQPGEFEAILDLYDRCPICELTIHPRVMRQLYRARPTAPLLQTICPTARCPSATTATSPPCPAESTGSGVLEPLRHHGGAGHHRRPGLLRQAVGGAPASKEELRGYLDELYHATPSLRHGQLCRQPDEGPLALPHPAVRGLRSLSRSSCARPGRAGSMRWW